MPLATNTNNILFGKGRLYYQDSSDTGLLDLGEVPVFSINVEVTTAEIFSNRQGTRDKILEVVTEKNPNATFEILEYSPENLNLAFLGDGITSSTQAAGTVTGSVTTVADRFVELGKLSVSILRLDISSASGTFTGGETITGGTSTATATLAWDASGAYLEVYNVSGTFVVGETVTGGTSTETATITAVDAKEDVCVLDAAPATATTRYVAGTDYDVDVDGGLIRELSGGSIAANTAYVYGDNEAKTLKTIAGLKNSQLEGKYVFIGDPDQGPKFKIEIWKANTTISGGAGFISEEAETISMNMSILSDASNHPDEPFFKQTFIE